MEIKIYQVNTDRDDNEIAFMPYSYAEIQGIEPYSYDMVYSGNLPANNLEEVFTILNTQHPEDYRGRSLSVSDVCEVITDGKSEFFYCDSIGFRQIDFDPSETQRLKEEEITVVALLPGKTAQITKIPSGLASYQKFVGGYIEAVYPFDDPVCIVCNEEGKINGLQLNRAIYTPDGEMHDIIAGSCFICDCSGKDFGSLSEDQQQRYLQMFHDPEIFFKVGDEIRAVKVQEQQQREERSQNHHRHR
jgi:hypothetical protein